MPSRCAVARRFGQTLQSRLTGPVLVFAEGQQRAEGPAGIDAKFAPGHAQPLFARVHETGLLAAEMLRVQSQTGQARLFGGAFCPSAGKKSVVLPPGLHLEKVNAGMTGFLYF